MLVVTCWRFSVSLKTNFLKIWQGSTLVKWCLLYIPYTSCIMCTGKVSSRLRKKHIYIYMKLILKLLLQIQMGTVATGKLLWAHADYKLYYNCYKTLNTKFWWTGIKSSGIYLTNLLLKLLVWIRLLDLLSVLFMKSTYHKAMVTVNLFTSAYPQIDEFCDEGACACLIVSTTQDAYSRSVPTIVVT